MNKLILFTISTVLMLLMSYCSEDTGTNNPQEKIYYFPFSNGSYWIADNWKLDKNKKRIDTTYYQDSTAVTGTQVFNGKSTFKVTIFKDGNEKETNYFWSDSTTLLANLSYILPGADDLGFELPVDKTDSLVLIADLNKNEWTIYEQLITNLVVELKSIKVTLNGTYTIKAKQGSTKKFESLSINSKEFIITHNFDGTANIGISLPLKFTLTVHYYYGENANLLQSVFEPVSIGISSFTQDVDGFESTVIKFNIAK